MSQKQVMPKSEDLSRSLEINAIWNFDTEFPTIFNKSCTYITFKSAVKHRQLGYGYPRGQTVHLVLYTGICILGGCLCLQILYLYIVCSVPVICHFNIYTSTIKSPSAVQISKSLKQTQSIDKI